MVEDKTICFLMLVTKTIKFFSFSFWTKANFNTMMTMTQYFFLFVLALSNSYEQKTKVIRILILAERGFIIVITLDVSWSFLTPTSSGTALKQFP